MTFRIIGVCRGVYSYIPREQPDNDEEDDEQEIDFSEDELLFLIEKGEDGWWKVKRTSLRNEGNIGLAPGNYLEEVIISECLLTIQFYVAPIVKLSSCWLSWIVTSRKKIKSSLWLYQTINRRSIFFRERRIRCIWEQWSRLGFGVQKRWIRICTLELFVAGNLG